MKTPVKKLTMAGLFTAIIAVLTLITIPTPFGIPFTLQTFSIALCGYFLGWKYGLAATGTYILLGIVGLPIFSGFGSGFGVLFGPTGGFLWGFLLLAACCGLPFRKKPLQIFAGLAGITLCHLLGILQYMLVANRSFAEAFFLISMTFLLKDVLSVAAAYGFSFALSKRKINSPM